MRARVAIIGLLSFFAPGCSDFKDGALPAGADASTSPDAATTLDGGVSVVVETLATGRNRPGARATAGYRPWRSGILVDGDRVAWVESGTQPGLYVASTSPCSTPCVTKAATFTRPSAFAPNGSTVYVADVNKLARFTLAGASTPVASSTAEIVNLATDGPNAYWTEGQEQEIHKTDATGRTSTLSYSNGTPVSIGVGADRVFWAGVDISGLLGAIQTVGTDGRGAREVSRFSNGIQAMRANGTYLYFARDTGPGVVHRLTLANGRDDVVDRDAHDVTDFAMDDTYVYWVEAGDAPEYTNGRVRRARHDEEKPQAQTLAVSIARPVAVAVSGASVYVASGGTAAAKYADGAILKLTIHE